MFRSISHATLFRAAAATLFALSLAACGGGSSGNAAVAPAATAGVALAASTYTVSQKAASVSVTVTRTGASTDAVSVAYATNDGTAIAGVDYTAASGTLEWAENDMTEKTVSVPLSTDTPFTGNKSFTLALTDPSTGAAIGNPGSASVMIAGDGADSVESVQLSDNTYTVAQNAGSLTVTVNRTGNTSGEVSVGYVTADGTAAAGTDYTATTGTLNWADGDAAAKTFSIPISGAAAFDGTKNFTVSLTNASGAAIGSPGSGIVTITGDSSPPIGSLVLSASSYSVAQDAGQVTITVNRTGGSNGAVGVSYRTSNGTAVSGTDYTRITGTLQWADGDTAPKTFHVLISNAEPFSGSQAFTVSLSSPTAGATVGSPSSATVTIAGGASATVGSVSLSASSYTVAQLVGIVNVSVKRTGGATGAISVNYRTSSGTAVSGTDFTSTSGKLSWADGDAATKTFTIPIINLNLFSGSKSFKVALSGPTGGAAVATPNSATVSITGGAANAVGKLQLSASSYSIAQSGGSLSITVNRTGGTLGAISVAYATANGTALAGTDYTSKSGTLSWATGDGASKTISVPVSNSTPYTGSKTFTVALSSPAGGTSLSTPSSASVSITGSKAAPAGSTLWVYYNGVFNWPGDWSSEATPNYKDTSGVPLEGPYDISVNSNLWGLWQPYVNGNCQTNTSLCFDTTKYKYLIFSFKPTVSGQVFIVGFMSKGDTTDGPVIDVSQYCGDGQGDPPVGQWTACKIPLTAFKLTDTTVLKFWIQDHTGLNSNHWYLDDVGFAVN